MNLGITFLLSVIGSLVLSVAGNFLSDFFKDWIGKRSLLQNQKNLSKLTKKLERITTLESDRKKLYLELSRTLIGIILTLSIGLAAGICGTAFYVMANNPPFFMLEGIVDNSFFRFNWFFYTFAMMGSVVAGALFMYIGITWSIDYLSILTNLLNYQDFKQQTESKIAELQKIEKEKN